MKCLAQTWKMSEVQLLRLLATFHILPQFYFFYTRKFYTRGHLNITRRLEIYPRTVLVSSGCIPLLEEGGWSFHVTSFLNIFPSLNINRYPMLTWQLNLSWKCHIKFINYLLPKRVPRMIYLAHPSPSTFFLSGLLTCTIWKHTFCAC